MCVYIIYIYIYMYINIYTGNVTLPAVLPKVHHRSETLYVPTVSVSRFHSRRVSCSLWWVDFDPCSETLYVPTDVNTPEVGSHP